MCTKPLFRVINFLQLDKNNRPETFFAQTESEIEARELYKPPNHIVQKVNCGQCIECRNNYARQWAFRAIKEAEKYEHNTMITLTYNDDNVPKGHKINPKTGEISESLTLSKEDHQKFMKRLRKHYYGLKIRFLLAGEYGEETERPHYHIILFNFRPDDMEFYRWSHCEWSKEKNPLYKSKTIEKIWGKGFVDLNEVNFETCRYVAGYVTKKLKGPKAAEEYELKGQVPPYICMSRNPGLAQEYFEENKEAFYEKKKIWAKTKKGLLEFKPGRYFDKLMEADNPERYTELKKERRKRSEEIMAEVLKMTSLNIDEYTKQKDYLSQQKLKKLKRQL